MKLFELKSEKPQYTLSLDCEGESYSALKKMLTAISKETPACLIVDHGDDEEMEYWIENFNYQLEENDDSLLLSFQGCSKKILEALCQIQYHCNVGHTHDIAINGKQITGFDGDGADRLVINSFNDQKIDISNHLKIKQDSSERWDSYNALNK